MLYSAKLLKRFRLVSYRIDYYLVRAAPFRGSRTAKRANACRYQGHFLPFAKVFGLRRFKRPAVSLFGQKLLKLCHRAAPDSVQLPDRHKRVFIGRSKCRFKNKRRISELFQLSFVKLGALRFFRRLRPRSAPPAPPARATLAAASPCLRVSLTGSPRAI